jgi:Zn-dependent metalloprotease
MFKSSGSILFSLLSSVLLVSNLVAAETQYNIKRDQFGQPRLVTLESGDKVSGAPSLSVEEATERAKDFLLSSPELALRLPASSSLRYNSGRQDKLGYTRVSFFQYHKGVPHYSAGALVNLDAAGKVVFADIGVSSNLPDRVTPKVKAFRANRIALRDANRFAGAREVLQASRTDLFIVSRDYFTSTPSSGPDRLTWVVSVSSSNEIGVHRTYFVDAISGEILKSYSTHDGLDRHIFDCAKQPDDPNCYLDSMGMDEYYHGRSESQPLRGPHNRSDMIQYLSEDVDYAHEMYGDFHGFVVDSFSINGPNNRGGVRKPIDEWPEAWAYVHAEGPSGEEAGTMCPGGALFTQNYSAVFCHNEVYEDVFAHEFGHGVTHWRFLLGSSPRGIDQGSPQTRSMGEATSDYYGELFEMERTGQNDWRQGSGGPWEDGLRNLTDPHATVDTHGNTHAQYLYDPLVNCDDFIDDGGYYINSTIFSFGLYLATDGGEFNGCTIEGQGMEFVKQVLFRAWDTKFVRDQKFKGAPLKINEACLELYPEEQCSELYKALQAVELDQADRTPDGDFRYGRCWNGVEGELAPPCAVKHAGDIKAVRPNGDEANLFAPGERLFLESYTGTPNRMVSVFVLPHNPDRSNWADFSVEAIHKDIVSFDQDGNLEILVQYLQQEGEFDLVVDGNFDGYYQPWADSKVSFTVATPIDGDNFCYQGEGSAFSENCQSSPEDCACGEGYVCRRSDDGNDNHFGCFKRFRHLPFELAH